MMVAWLRYLDTYAKVDENLSIADRQIILEWSETLPSVHRPPADAFWPAPILGRCRLLSVATIVSLGVEGEAHGTAGDPGRDGRRRHRRRAGCPAEVLVVDGRIAEVDATVDASGAEVLDAGGRVRRARVHRQPHAPRSVVVLGPCCDPLPQHGVTTVLIGNCSLGLAPMRRDLDRRGRRSVLLHRGHPPDDVRRAASRGLGSVRRVRDAHGDGGSASTRRRCIGHSVLRMFVMGDDAWERAASADERAETDVGAR